MSNLNKNSAEEKNKDRLMVILLCETYRFEHKPELNIDPLEYKHIHKHINTNGSKNCCVVIAEPDGTLHDIVNANFNQFKITSKLRETEQKNSAKSELVSPEEMFRKIFNIWQQSVSGMNEKEKHSFNKVLIVGKTTTHFTQSLAESLKKVIQNNLKDNGEIRVQICQVKNKKIEDTDTLFFNYITPSNCHLTIPSQYSIIFGSDTRAIDVNHNLFFAFKKHKARLLQTKNTNEQIMNFFSDTFKKSSCQTSYERNSTTDKCKAMISSYGNNNVELAIKNILPEIHIVNSHSPSNKK